MGVHGRIKRFWRISVGIERIGLILGRYLVRGGFSRGTLDEVDDLEVGCEDFRSTMGSDDARIGAFVKKCLDHGDMTFLHCFKKRRGAIKVFDLDIDWRCFVEQGEDSFDVPLRARRPE